MKNFMKKLAAAVVTALILAGFPAMTAYCGITNFSFETAAATYTQVEGTAIYTEACVADEDIVQAVSGWLLLPENVRVSLVEYGCNIYLSETAQSEASDDGTFTVGQAHGARFSYYESSLKIVGMTSAPYIICRTEGDIEGTVLHESGHILDMTIALLEEGTYQEDSHRISSSAEWTAIYTTYQEALAAIDRRTSVNMYNAAEGFAECFRLTCQNPEALIAVCPEAYEYVVQVVDQYCS